MEIKNVFHLYRVITSLRCMSVYFTDKFAVNWLNTINELIYEICLQLFNQFWRQIVQRDEEVGYKKSCNAVTLCN
jgi:hypothetical protein